MSFYEKLSSLMEEKELSINDLAEKLNLKTTTIYTWKQKEILPSLTNAVKLADYFNCSLDYLFGNKLLEDNVKFKKCPPFDEQLKLIMEKQKITQYKLIKDKMSSSQNFHRWFVKKSVPNMTTIIKWAEYFNLSLDEFVGRV